MFNRNLFSIETSQSSFTIIKKEKKCNTALPVVNLAEESTVESIDLDGDSSCKSLSCTDINLETSSSVSDDSCQPKCTIKLWKSQCFIEILKQVYLLHKDVEPHHLSRL